MIDLFSTRSILLDLSSHDITLMSAAVDAWCRSEHAAVKNGNNFYVLFKNCLQMQLFILDSRPWDSSSVCISVIAGSCLSMSSLHYLISKQKQTLLEVEHWYWPSRGAPCRDIIGKTEVCGPTASPWRRRHHVWQINCMHRQNLPTTRIANCHFRVCSDIALWNISRHVIIL